MILLYRDVRPDAAALPAVTVDAFYRQMHELAHKTAVHLHDYDPDNAEHLVITFDGVPMSILTYAAPILQYFNRPFELFVPPDSLRTPGGRDPAAPDGGFCGRAEISALTRIGGRLQCLARSPAPRNGAYDTVIRRRPAYIPPDVRALDPDGFQWVASPHGAQPGAGSTGDHAPIADDLDPCTLCRTTVDTGATFRREKIAVIIASYNHGRFLVEAVESVLRQTILPHEILISDDGSTDTTQEIALQYARNHPGLIRYNRNEKNLGTVAHFNKAIGLTTAEYVMFLGADNRLLSNYIEETSRLLDQDDALAIAYTDFALFGHWAPAKYHGFEQEWQGPTKQNYFIIRFPRFTPESAEHLLRHGNFIHGSAMYRRSAFLRAGGYLDDPMRPEDWGLFRRMIQCRFTARKAEKTMLEYRQHSREQVNARFASQQAVLLHEATCRQALKELAAQKETVHRLKHKLREQRERAKRELAEQKQMVRTLRKSCSYRIGRAMLKPFVLLRGMLPHPKPRVDSGSGTGCGA